MMTINAVFVDGSQKKRQFIVTQVPLETTSGHFWCMVKQNKIQQILVLNEPAKNEVQIHIIEEISMHYFDFPGRVSSD